jgi:hypothetical protein
MYARRPHPGDADEQWFRIRVYSVATLNQMSSQAVMDIKTTGNTRGHAPKKRVLIVIVLAFGLFLTAAWMGLLVWGLVNLISLFWS